MLIRGRDIWSYRFWHLCLLSSCPLISAEIKDLVLCHRIAQAECSRPREG